jgi:hypothetical protein
MECVPRELNTKMRSLQTLSTTGAHREYQTHRQKINLSNSPFIDSSSTILNPF